jgi:hypothetical protein
MINGVLKAHRPLNTRDVFYLKDRVLVFIPPAAGIFLPLPGVSCTHPKRLPAMGLIALEWGFEYRLFEYSVQYISLTSIQN